MTNFKPEVFQKHEIECRDGTFTVAFFKDFSDSFDSDVVMKIVEFSMERSVSY